MVPRVLQALARVLEEGVTVSAWLVIRALVAVGLFCHATTIESAPALWVWFLLGVAVWRLLVAAWSATTVSNHDDVR